MIGKYDRIDFVKYNNGTETFLMCGKDVEENFEVDLKADCFFNTEFEVIERKTVMQITDLRQVIEFVKTNLGIDLHFKNYHETGMYLLVGAEKDCLVYIDLEFDWIEN